MGAFAEVKGGALSAVPEGDARVAAAETQAERRVVEDTIGVRLDE